MKIAVRLFSLFIFLAVVGTLVVSVARKLLQTSTTQAPIKVLNANESYKFEERNVRKTK